jgi:tyrosyl-tRNA synthetase
VGGHTLVVAFGSVVGRGKLLPDMKATQPDLHDLLVRGTDTVIDQPRLEAALAAGAQTKKLRIKFGVDPTRPDLHIGHAVVLSKLRQFQDLGHTVIFLIGDYTTKIGDPSGRNQTRPMLSDAQIQANVKTYLEQVGRLLDVKKAEIRYNSEWLGALDFGQLIQLASNVSVAQTIEREDFKQRLQAGSEIALHELLYPLMQAYDSVALEADVEFGGSDQLFNLMAGRALQKKLGQVPQIVFTCQLLVGLDGVKKMSKSLDNYVGVTDAPIDMYGKIMTLPDKLIAPYYELCTDIPLTTIAELVKTLAAGANPRDTKASLAHEIVARYHSPAAAGKAETDWNATFRDRQGPAAGMVKPLLIDNHSATLAAVLLEHGLRASRSQIRTLIEQNGIRINGQSATSLDQAVKAGDELNIGKAEFYKLKNS